MRNGFLAGLFLLAGLSSMDAGAQQFAGGVFDPQGGTFQIRTHDGTLVVADRVTERIFITDPLGRVAEMTFEQAVASSEPDPARRLALLNSLRTGMRNPDAGGALAFPVEPYRSEPNPCPDNGSLPGGGEVECNLELGEPGLNSIKSDAAGDLPKPVDLDTISVTGMRPEMLLGTGGATLYYSGSTGSYSNPGGSVSWQRYYADDYNQWKHRRSEACDAAHIQSFVVAGSIAVTVGACGVAAASGGIAAFACGGAFVASLGAWMQMSASSKVCSSTYPGPGNW